MNPATDAGKRELPAALRARFTELWVPEPRGREDLALLVAGYLAGAAPAPPVEAVVDLYVAAKQAAVSGGRVCICLLTCWLVLLGLGAWPGLVMEVAHFQCCFETVAQLVRVVLMPKAILLAFGAPWQMQC
jgi:hypothetical protein